MEASIIINYLPGLGAVINEMKFNWKEKRADVRRLLLEEFEESDSVIDMSHYNGGSRDFDISQRRDIYHKINGKDCLVFFNYDTEDLLRDIESHAGTQIFIDELRLGFDLDIVSAVRRLSEKYGDPKVVDYETYLFESIKLVIASNEAMGGEGDYIGYSYMSTDISHLIE